MGDDWHDGLGRWIDAERHAPDEAADAAFASLFHTVPRRDPPDGFTSRVMAAIARSEREAQIWVNAWWMKGVVAASMILTGMIVGSLAPAGLAVSGLTWLARGVGTGAWVLDLLVSGFAKGLGVWSVLAEAGRTAGLVLQAPSVCLFILANLVVAASSFAALQRLLGQEEEVA